MPNDFKPSPAILGKPTLKQRTREEHDKILLLMEQNKLSWDEACAAYERATSGTA